MLLVKAVADIFFFRKRALVCFSSHPTCAIGVGLLVSKNTTTCYVASFRGSHCRPIPGTQPHRNDRLLDRLDIQDTKIDLHDIALT